mgnify:CR=1 FL=1
MQNATDVVETSWSVATDGFDAESLRNEAGYGLWSSYSGSSTSPGKCC